ncbi:hypothetical protein Tco_0002350 [Tanacetum coccineum]
MLPTSHTIPLFTVLISIVIAARNGTCQLGNGSSLLRVGLGQNEFHGENWMFVSRTRLTFIADTSNSLSKNPEWNNLNMIDNGVRNAIKAMDAVVAVDVVHYHSHVELVKCESCGFTEECTLPYISQIKEHYHGRWICGLCMEAVKYEILRSGNLITTEEALDRHIDFCNNFRSSCRLPFSDADHPISVMGRIIRRRLDSLRQNGGKIGYQETL